MKNDVIVADELVDAPRRVGRPTKYFPEYCDRVIDLGGRGYSKAQMAAELGCSRLTLDNWAKEFPEFMNAIAHARDLALAWWEHQAMTGMWQDPSGAKLNPQLWSRSMAARFPEDYREDKEDKITQSDLALAILEARKRISNG